MDIVLKLDDDESNKYHDSSHLPAKVLELANQLMSDYEYPVSIVDSEDNELWTG